MATNPQPTLDEEAEELLERAKERYHKENAQKAYTRALNDRRFVVTGSDVESILNDEGEEEVEENSNEQKIKPKYSLQDIIVHIISLIIILVIFTSLITGIVILIDLIIPQTIIPTEQAPFTQLCAGLIIIGGTMTVAFYNGVLRNYLSPEIIMESE